MLNGMNLAISVSPIILTGLYIIITAQNTAGMWLLFKLYGLLLGSSFLYAMITQTEKDFEPMQTSSSKLFFLHSASANNSLKSYDQ